MTTAEKYVTAAYLVVLAVVLTYVVIYAFKLQRLDREVRRLEEERQRGEEADRKPEVVEVGRR
jgi:cell division protein FtsL